MGFNENDRNKTSRCRHCRRCRIYAEIDLIRWKFTRRKELKFSIHLHLIFNYDEVFIV